jgi:flagellar motility protein MotE (MotC chaperone)
MRIGATGEEAPGAAAARIALLCASILGAALVLPSPATAQTSWSTVVAPAKAAPRIERAAPKKPASAKTKAPAKIVASDKVPEPAKPAETVSLPAPAKPGAAPKPMVGPAFETFMGRTPFLAEPAQGEGVRAPATAPIETGSAPPRKPAAAEAPTFSTSAARQYCVNIADAAADARFAYQKKALLEMAQELEMRVGLLEEKIAEYSQWVTRRDEFVKKARDSLVLIYGRMRPDAAAMQLVAMDEETAASVLLKLDARIASTILNEMEPNKAARLTATISGAAREPPGPPPSGNAGAGKS